MKFAVMMLLGATVSASSQIIEPQAQSLWSVSMDNDKYKEIAAEDKALGKDMEKFANSHPEVKAEAGKLGKIFHNKMQKLEVRLGKTKGLLADPKYQDEINAIAAKMHALDLKIRKALKWDDEGLKMWKLHMNNKKFKQIAKDDAELDRDIKHFINTHPKIKKELAQLTQEIEAEFREVGHRLEKTGKMLENPKYKKELRAIGRKWRALDRKFKANLHWDDEGLKMWKVSMDPKVDREIQQDKAEIARDFKGLGKPLQKLDWAFKRYQMDQQKNWADVAHRFEMAAKKLDTPKHQAQLRAIGARYERLQRYVDKEEFGIYKDLEAFMMQPEVQAELKDLDHDVAKEFHEMDMRYKRFEMDVDTKFGPAIAKRLEEIGRKMEALDYKIQRNIKFDPETKMWKLSMDNKVAAELEKEELEIKQDIENFASKIELEMQDVEKELHECAAMLDDPKYKAELEAIANKMKALDAKWKANLKWEP